MLVPGLLVLGTPSDDFTFQIDIRPSKLTDGADAVSRLVRENESNVKAPIDFPRYVQQRLVFRLGKDYPGRILLGRRCQALQRIRLKKQSALLVPRLRGPVQDREQ